MEQTKTKPVLRGEIALLVVICINSLGVVLMLHSGSGISTISSVPYVLSEVLAASVPRHLELSVSGASGAHPDAFKTALCALLSVLLSHGLCHEHDDGCPQSVGHAAAADIFAAGTLLLGGYAIIAFGIALANRCKMPIAPTDLFPRELADITKIPFSKIKVAFDVCCLSFTAVLGLVFLHHLAGLGIGTVIAALTTGKAVGAINRWMDRHWEFTSFLEPKEKAVD